MAKKITPELSTTFAEYILLPGLTDSTNTPENISLRTPLTKFKTGEEPKISLNLPFTSAVMQAVSGHKMGIALAKEGGLSFIFTSQTIKNQAEMVAKVKNFKAGFVNSKANLSPENTLEDALKLTDETGYSTIAITRDGQNNSELMGILTKQDYWLDYEPLTTPLGQLMTPFEKINHGLEGITLPEANEILRKSKKSCIPIINNESERILKALVFKKDREKHKDFPDELIDEQKRIIAGAGINSKDYVERVPALVSAGADVLVIDTSDGWNQYVGDALKWIKTNYPNIPCGAGNIVSAEAFDYLVSAGADFVKVGIGGGSICITQEVKGIGRGQASALLDIVSARDKYFDSTGIYVPICSDGGLVQDSHITIALALGADFVMMGRYFARCDESPTEKKILNHFGLAKPYWGEGSDRAKNWQRYGQENGNIKFEEGVDGWVPYAGPVKDIVRRSGTVIKSTLSNLGCNNLKELHERAVLEKRSPTSMREGKPHDIQIGADNMDAYKKMYWGE
ncbi:MAG: IMP dehydrogenase [bacterium]